MEALHILADYALLSQDYETLFEYVNSIAELRVCINVIHIVPPLWEMSCIYRTSFVSNCRRSVSQSLIQLFQLIL